MDAVKNLLGYIYENWATIAAIFALAFAIYQKARKSWADWQAKSEAEKQKELEAAEAKAIAEARAAIGNFILSLVARAEIEFSDAGSKLGPVKRASVIDALYTRYPVLLAVADQEELLAFIDAEIDKALETVRKTIRTEVVTTNV